MGEIFIDSRLAVEVIIGVDSSAPDFARCCFLRGIGVLMRGEKATAGESSSDFIERIHAPPIPSIGLATQSSPAPEAYSLSCGNAVMFTSFNDVPTFAYIFVDRWRSFSAARIA